MYTKNVPPVPPFQISKYATAMSKRRSLFLFVSLKIDSPVARRSAE